MARGNVKLVASIDQPTADTISMMVAKEGITVTEAVRRIAAVAHMMYEEKYAGRKIMTMEQDGSDQAEIILL